MKHPLFKKNTVTFGAKMKFARWVLSRTDFPAQVKVVMTGLLDHLDHRTGQCNPKDAVLGKTCGMPERCVQRWTAAAQKAGLITKKLTRGAPVYAFNFGLAQQEDGPPHPADHDERWSATSGEDGPPLPAKMVRHLAADLNRTDQGTDHRKEERECPSDTQESADKNPSEGFPAHDGGREAMAISDLTPEQMATWDAKNREPDKVQVIDAEYREIIATVNKPETKPASRPAARVRTDVLAVVQDAYEAYVAVAGAVGTPVPTQLTSKRLADLKARLKESGRDGWQYALDAIAKSPFLQGKTGKWQITFDWLVKPDNFLKVLENHYIDRRGNGRSTDSDFIERIRALRMEAERNE